MNTLLHNPFGSGFVFLGEQTEKQVRDIVFDYMVYGHSSIESLPNEEAVAITFCDVLGILK